jgi:hypothetical protein
LTVTVGNAKVGVAVIVGVNVIVGVKVMVGVNVSVAVIVCEGVTVNVCVAVAVSAGTVAVAVAGPPAGRLQAVANRKTSKMIPEYVFISFLLKSVV